MNASASARSKSQRSLRTGPGIQVRIVWPPAVLDEIDNWAAAQPEKSTRSDAILRLVRRGLAAADKQSEMPPHSLSNALKAGRAAQTASAPITAVPPLKRDDECLRAEARQTIREVKWKPRLVEDARLPVPQRQVSAQPKAKPLDDNKPYEMPEDITVFNEYWKLAELMAGRRLEYEEVVVAYNRYRRRRRYGPVLLLTDIE
jgi:hypothetical protein